MAPTSDWSDPDARFEIIDGVQVELPPISAYSAEVGNRIYRKLGQFLDKNDLGQTQHEVLFRLPLPRDRNRIPDVAFTSYERWPRDRPFPYRGNARDVVPDLAVEVVSPTDFIEELLTKIDEYFRAGVRLVWLVHCSLKMIYVYRSNTDVRILSETEDLDGGEVLPGLRISVASLFPPVIRPEPPPSDQ